MSTTLVKSIDSKDLYAARAVADKDGNAIDSTYAKVASLSAGEGLVLNGTQFKADVVNQRPWNNLINNQGWCSSLIMGTHTLTAQDISSGIIKLMFDNVQWPFTETAVEYCNISLFGCRLYKNIPSPSLTNQVWHSRFKASSTRTSDRYESSVLNIHDFDWKWDGTGLSTNYFSPGAFIADIRTVLTGTVFSLDFDVSYYKSNLATGDTLHVNGEVWPLSTRCFQYTY